MAEETQEATGIAGLSDEQIVENFPGQDVAHVRSMAEKMAGVKAPVDSSLPSDADINADTVEYPEYIPEKFRTGSVEDAMAAMAKSYSELEKSHGKPPAKPDATSEADIEADADGRPPVSMARATDEFIKNNGKVSQDTLDALAEKGMSEELVTDYIAGQQAIANQLVTKVHAIAGGESEYSQLMDWAGQNWSEGEIDAYDAVMSKGDEGSIKLALNGLKAAYVTAEGKPPANLVNGQSDGTTTVGYQSKAQMTSDMKDPRYKTDASFRESVKQKMANSSIWGARK